MKEEKGITIITLAVTIIVLVILAGISINTAIGDNGIFTQAKKQRENIELAQEEGQKQLNSLYAGLDTDGDGSFDLSVIEAIEKLENFKQIIATAITKEGVNTASTDTAEKMAENIGKIFEERTKDASATAEDIAEGKIAYVKGEKVVGTAVSHSTSNQYYIYEGDNRLVTRAKLMTGASVGGCGVQILPAYLRVYINLTTYWYSSANAYYELETTFDNNGYDSLKLSIGNNNQVDQCTVTLMDAERNVLDTQTVSGTVGSESSGEIIFQNVPERFRLAFTVNVYNSGPNQGTGVRIGESYIKNIVLYSSNQPENEYYIYRGENFLAMTANPTSGNVGTGATIGTSDISLYMNLSGYWYTAGTAEYAFSNTFENEGYSSLRLEIANNSEVDSCKVNLLDESGNIIETKEVAGALSIADVTFHNIPNKFKLSFVTNVFNSGPNQTTGGRTRY